MLQIDDSHVVPTNYSPFGHVITADEPSMYDTTYFDASLQVKICNVEMQIHTISPIINRIEQVNEFELFNYFQHLIVSSTTLKQYYAFEKIPGSKATDNSSN